FFLIIAVCFSFRRRTAGGRKLSRRRHFQPESRRHGAHETIDEGRPQETGMSETENGGELLTLTEVANRTGISMPTLQRYKKEYQDRIPSVGRGRKQRYPASALGVFEE